MMFFSTPLVIVHHSSAEKHPIAAYDSLFFRSASLAASVKQGAFTNQPPYLKRYIEDLTLKTLTVSVM